jgi:transposase
MKKTANYTSEFKREAVKLALSAGKPTSQIAVELGIKANTLYNWISLAMKKQKSLISAKQPPKHRYKELELENKRLEKELKRTQMERDILKKAAAYFASQEL